MQIVEQSGMILISGGTSDWLEIWDIDDIGVLSHNRGQGFRIAINSYGTRRLYPPRYEVAVYCQGHFYTRSSRFCGYFICFLIDCRKNLMLWLVYKFNLR